MPEPTCPPPATASKGRTEAQDRHLARQVILELLRRGPWEVAPSGTRGLTREAINHLFWLAHLYYAKNNPGYLTTWPIIRKPWGVQLREDIALLRDLTEDELIRTEQMEVGPFPVTLYCLNDKPGEAALSPKAVHAIQLATQLVLGPPQGFTMPFFCPLPFSRAWPLFRSRAWQTTPDGEEMDIYLDLVPEELYDERRQQLERLAQGLEDLFS